MRRPWSSCRPPAVPAGVPEWCWRSALSEYRDLSQTNARSVCQQAARWRRRWLPGPALEAERSVARVSSVLPEYLTCTESRFDSAIQNSVRDASNSELGIGGPD